MKNSQRNSGKYQPCTLLHRAVTSSPSILFACSPSSLYATVMPRLTLTVLCSIWTPHSLSALRAICLTPTTLTFNTAMPHSNTTNDCSWRENVHFKCGSLHSLLVTTYYNYQEMKNMHFTAFSFHMLKKHGKISTNTAGSLMHEATLCTLSMIYYWTDKSPGLCRCRREFLTTTHCAYMSTHPFRANLVNIKSITVIDYPHFMAGLWKVWSRCCHQVAI